jgi:hypothetical protein
MPEIALRPPIAYFPGQISDFALHPDAMLSGAYLILQGRRKSQKDCRYEREIFS